MSPLQVTDETFTAVVLAANKPVIVDFWAEWCAPCHTVNIWMANLAEAYADQLIVATIDADKNKTIVDNYNVRGLPTILFFYRGSVMYRQVDEINEVGLRTLVSDFLTQI